MAKRQIINPYLRFGATASGVYANRISAGSYAISLNRKTCPEIVPNNDFSNGTTDWNIRFGVGVVSSNILTLTNDNTRNFAYADANNATPMEVETGKTYKAICRYRTVTGDYVRFAFSGAYSRNDPSDNESAGQWKIFEREFVAASDSLEFSWILHSSDASPKSGEFDYVSVKCTN